MSISRFVPPLDYLKAASRTSLQSFELARRNHAANLRREIAALLDQWIQEASEATLARWMLDHHDSFHDLSSSASGSLSIFPDVATVPVPESSAQVGEIVCAPPRFSHPQRQIKTAIGRKAPKHRPTDAS